MQFMDSFSAVASSGVRMSSVAILVFPLTCFPLPRQAVAAGAVPPPPPRWNLQRRVQPPVMSDTTKGLLSDTLQIENPHKDVQRSERIEGEQQHELQAPRQKMPKTKTNRQTMIRNREPQKRLQIENR
jgi:hypothetical protein